MNALVTQFADSIDVAERTRLLAEIRCISSSSHITIPDR